MKLISDNNGVKIYTYNNADERNEHISEICHNKVVSIKIYGNNKTDVPLTAEIKEV